MRVYIFFITITAILILIDSYTIGSFQKFIKRRGANPWYYRSLWIAAGFFLLLSIPVNNIKFSNPNPEYYIKVMSSLVFVWYLPKLPIFLVLVIKDIIRLILFLVRKILGKERNSGDRRPSNWAIAGWSLALIPFAIYIYSSTVTTTNFEVKRVEVTLQNLPKNLDGFKIAQISDIHPPSFYSAACFWEVRQLVQATTPDMVVITGDFVNNHPDELDLIYDEMTKFSAPHGVYGCIGNHDHYMTDELHEKLKVKIEEAGVDLLVNENITLEIKGEKLQLAGVDNSSWQLDYADFDKTFEGLSDVYTTILLCHDPVDWQNNVRNSYKADLTLSGHTHGGQIGFDIFGYELAPAVLAYNYWRGLYYENGKYIYVNTGIGTVGPPIRIGDLNPEITLIVLRSPDNLANDHKPSK